MSVKGDSFARLDVDGRIFRGGFPPGISSI
jgi:hypothetical protein